MSKFIASNLLIPAYVVMIMIIFILPFFSVDGYSIIKHSTSELGAQSAPNAWIMNMTYIMLGLASVHDGWKPMRGLIFHRAFLLIFGACLILCAFFRHAPIDPSIQFDQNEDDWHSMFAGLTGLSFTVLAVACGFIENKFEHRILDFTIGLMAAGLSMLMFIFDDFSGMIQRFIFIVSFLWMIYLFRRISSSIE